MISAFQRNRIFRKVSVNKTSTHVQEQKKAMSPRHSAYIPSSVKPPLNSDEKNYVNFNKYFRCSFQKMLSKADFTLCGISALH